MPEIYLRVVAHPVVYRQHNGTRQDVGIPHALQIDERRIAQDARVCVEHLTADTAQHDEQHQCVHHHAEVLSIQRPVIEHEVADQAREQQDEAVEQKDAPEGQGVLIEIPIEDLTKWIHLSLSLYDHH